MTEPTPSPRQILTELFSDVRNAVNDGAADDAADEVIEALKEHGWIIVSNTLELFPVRPAKENTQ